MTKEQTMTAMDLNRSEVSDFAMVRDARDDLIIAAEMLRMREIEVVLGWKAGETIAAMARGAGVDAKTVIDALIDDQKADLAERVEWGELRAEVAEQMRLAIPTNVVAFVYYGLPEVRLAPG
jgi:hypothetical protein